MRAKAIHTQTTLSVSGSKLVSVVADVTDPFLFAVCVDYLIKLVFLSDQLNYLEDKFKQGWFLQCSISFEFLTSRVALLIKQGTLPTYKINASQ